MTNKRTIGLVIGSGAVKCAGSIGLLRVLEREGISIDLAVGCSGGSLYAGMVSLGSSIETMEEDTRNLWTPEVMKGYTSNLSAVRSGEKRFTEKSGLVDDEVLNHNLKEAFKDTTFYDTKIPLYVVATDFMSGEQVIITEGSLFDAVRASIAIPTIFPPWEIEGRLLVDGAVSNPLPIDVAIQHGADIIIAMGFELDLRGRMRSMLAVNTHLNNLYINNLLRANLSFHTLVHHHEIILIIPTFDRSITAFDTEQIPHIIEEGERVAEEEVLYLKELLAQ